MHKLYPNVFDNAILRGLRQTMMGKEGAYLPHTPRPPQADGLAAGENPLLSRELIIPCWPVVIPQIGVDE